MFLLKRFSPYLIIILNISVLEILIKKPTLIFWLAPILVFLILFLAGLVAQKSLGFKAISRFILKYFLLEVVLIASLVFLENNVIKQVLIIATTLALALHQEYLFRFLYRPEKYKAYSLENLSSSMNLLTMLLLALAIFGLMVFMNMALWSALILAVIVTGACFAIFLVAAKIEIRKNKWYMIMAMFLMVEIFVILSWLPFNFYLKALLFSTFYYLVADLSRHVIGKTANTKAVFWPTLVGGLLWVLLLVTARWT
ncbi:MAG: hypothetical protein PHT40_03170 [Patescibacteria group bacterium]|nr:hypothetical protein [Patescibacteria group bacterium]